jgi:hypothetical protein
MQYIIPFDTKIKNESTVAKVQRNINSKNNISLLDAAKWRCHNYIEKYLVRDFVIKKFVATSRIVCDLFGLICEKV